MLQEKKLSRRIIPVNLFEERNMEAFTAKIRKTVSGNQICHQADDVQLGTESDPDFYDLDGNLN